MIVADASVIATVLANDEQIGERVRVLFRAAGEVAIPDVAIVETVAALRKGLRRGDFDENRLGQAIADLSRFPFRVCETRAAVGRMHELRHNVSPYDAAYVWLAETFGCVLVTSDARLASAPQIRCDVHLVH